MEIDRTMDNIETALSIGAAIPFLGRLPAAAKVIMGVAQLIAAVVYGIFSLMRAAIHKDYSYLDRYLDCSWTHIRHGVGNIFAGLLEGIPFIGTVMFGMRLAMACSEIGEDKFMPYASLNHRPIIFND